MPSTPSDHAPLKGSHCAEHPERPAYVVCPRCSANACVSCWHPSLARCQRCLQRDPAAAAEPIPWERDLSLTRRFVGTLATALHPVRSAPAFAVGDLRKALHFALLSAVLPALLAGIVPHTRTLVFGDMTVKLLGHPSELQIALDVVRAMLVQLVLSGVAFGCLFFPYVSLVRAYAPPTRHTAATRALLYRAWLLPTSQLLMYAAETALPSIGPEVTAPPGIWYLGAIVTLVSQVLLMTTMGATARLACGLGPFLSFLVVVVPVLIMLLAEPLLTVGVQHLLQLPPFL